MLWHNWAPFSATQFHWTGAPNSNKSLLWQQKLPLTQMNAIKITKRRCLTWAKTSNTLCNFFNRKAHQQWTQDFSGWFCWKCLKAVPLFSASQFHCPSSVGSFTWSWVHCSVQRWQWKAHEKCVCDCAQKCVAIVGEAQVQKRLSQSSTLLLIVSCILSFSLPMGTRQDMNSWGKFALTNCTCTSITTILMTPFGTQMINKIWKSGAAHFVSCKVLTQEK